MKFKHFLIFVILFITSRQGVFAQPKFSKIKVAKEFKDTLSFTNQWDYPPGTIKDDTGVFFGISDDLIDTTHLFFSANCTTNVQGGYQIRYCFADKVEDKIVLTFSDGLPAYASEYYIYIKDDSFSFRPETVYPASSKGEKTSYQITKQKLILTKSSYKPGDTIIGYVDTEFIETVSSSNRETESHKLYLRGFIKTVLTTKEK